jgi:hypothetical protein
MNEEIIAISDNSIQRKNIMKKNYLKYKMLFIFISITFLFSCVEKQAKDL